MCNVCEIAEEVGQEKVEIIAERVSKQVQDLYHATILTILAQLGVDEFILQGEVAGRTYNDHERGALILHEDDTIGDGQFRFWVERKEIPEQGPDEILQALMRELGLG